MPSDTPLLLGYEPAKPALPVIESETALLLAGLPGGGKLLVVDEFWSLFARPPVFAGGLPHASRYPDRPSDWRMLVHGEEARVQAFWDEVCVTGMLDTELEGVVGEELQLDEETGGALVLQWRSTLAHRNAAQVVFEARYPELAFQFSWGPRKYLYTSGRRSKVISVAIAR